MFNLSFKISAAISLLLMFSSAQAAFITYTNSTAWEAAAGSFTTENFTGDDGSFDGVSLDVGDFTLTGDSTGTYADMTISSGVVMANACGVITCGSAFGYILTFDFPIFGFGADFSNVFGFAGISLSTDSETIGGPTNDIGFWGFVSDTAFTTITVSSLDEIHSFDNAVYTTAEVPVPATISLFFLGLAGIGWSRRKKA